MTSHPIDYPEEYTKWSVHFFGRDFIVTPDVLIPRLETECLIRRARKLILEKNIQQVIDIGCGSGIIGTSVADLIDTVVFLDISPEALRITETNFFSSFPGKQADFIMSDLLTWLSESSLNWNLPILFLTNLPYIKDADWNNMSADTQFEPKIALFGGEKTGFELYERLFMELAKLPIRVNQGHCIFEFWYDQREIAEATLKQFPHWKCCFFADYAGIERFGEIIL